MNKVKFEKGDVYYDVDENIDFLDRRKVLKVFDGVKEKIRKSHIPVFTPQAEKSLHISLSILDKAIEDIK